MASPYQPYATQMAQKYGVPLNIFLAQINQESGWQPEVVSSAGAIGLGQLMPGTAKGLGVDPNNPYQNLQGAAEYDASLHKQFGSWDSALQAYNEGPGAFALNHGTSQTSQYANAILGAAGDYAKAVVPSSSDNDIGGNSVMSELNSKNPKQFEAGLNQLQEDTPVGATTGKRGFDGCPAFAITDPIPWLECEAGNLVLILIGLVVVIFTIGNLIRSQSSSSTIPVIPVE